MAGYGTDVTASSQYDDLLRALLTAAQRRARAIGLRMSFRRQSRGALTDWSLIVDGNGYLIAAWSQQLERDLPVVAEGYVGTARNSEARHLATSLVARWIDWCVGDNDDEKATVSTHGRDRVRWIWPVLDIPHEASPLYARLVISDELIGRWIVGELPEELAIEEFHTTIEALLRHLTDLGPTATWPPLLGRSKRLGYLSGAEGRTLHSFNRLHRNRVKHEGLALSVPERAQARAVLYDVLTIAERLLSRAAKRVPAA